MSYDFTLYRLAPGGKIENVLGTDSPDEGEPDPRPVLPWDKPLRTRVTTALKKLHPAFEVFDQDEVNDEETGLQIELFPSEASLAVPYWHKGADAKRVFTLIWSCLRAMRDAAGAVIYDPQLDKVLDLDRDHDKAVRVYLDTIKAAGI